MKIICEVCDGVGHFWITHTEFVTKEMAMDAGDLSLEGSEYNWWEEEKICDCCGGAGEIEGHLCDGFEGPCENTNAIYVRMRTYYQKEEDNHMWLCPECQEVARKYWDEMWEEYYSG